MPFVCVPVLSPVLLLSPVTVLPCQLGAESDRAPCPAPFTCHCHLSTHNISRFFPRPCRLPAPPPAEGEFGRSGRLLYLVCSPAHMYDCLRLSVMHAPPPCLMFANVSLFFFAIPHLTVPLLGSVGGFIHCFWVSLGLPCEGPTPLSSSPYPSVTSPPTKPCLSCLAPSSSITFQKNYPPFVTPNLSL